MSDTKPTSTPTPPEGFRQFAERCWKACLLEIEPPVHDTYPFAIWDRCRILQDSNHALESALAERQRMVENLRTIVLELCEKMESCVSGAEETKRARAML